MEEKQKCPNCQSFETVKNGHYTKNNNKIQKHKCKKCGCVFRADKGYKYKNKAERAFALQLFNLMRLPYCKLRNGLYKINFKNLFSDLKINETEFDNISLTLTDHDDVSHQKLTPNVSLYFSKGNIVISKKLGK